MDKLCEKHPEIDRDRIKVVDPEDSNIASDLKDRTRQDLMKEYSLDI